MLHRNTSCTKDGLKGGDIQPQNRHCQREDDGWEESPILRRPVEQGRMLHNAKPASSRRHQIKPLHDNEIDKVDGGSLVDSLGVVLLTDAIGNFAEGKPELAEWDAVALQVPVGHGERGESLENAHETVGLENELPVDEAVFLDVARTTEEHVSFGLLV